MSSFEPYAPPSPGSELTGAMVNDADYRPAGGLTMLIVILLAAHVVIAAVGIGSELMQLELLERMGSGDFTAEEVDANDMRVGMIALVYLTLFLASSISICIWFNRMNKNARGLGAEHMDYGPNAWGWFFCPLLNLWRPLNAFQELWTASQDPTRAKPVPGYFMVWWIGWLCLSIAGRIQSRMVDSEEIDELIAASQLSVGVEVALAVAALALILVVRGIQTNQVEYAEQRMRG